MPSPIHLRTGRPSIGPIASSRTGTVSAAPIQNRRVTSKALTTAGGGAGSVAGPGGNRKAQCSMVRPAASGSSSTTKAWFGSTDSSTLGNSVTNRPLVASERSRPAAGGSVNQSSR